MTWISLDTCLLTVLKKRREKERKSRYQKIVLVRCFLIINARSVSGSRCYSEFLSMDSSMSPVQWHFCPIVESLESLELTYRLSLNIGDYPWFPSKTMTADCDSWKMATLVQAPSFWSIEWEVYLYNLCLLYGCDLFELVKLSFSPIVCILSLMWLVQESLVVNLTGWQVCFRALFLLSI